MAYMYLEHQGSGAFCDSADYPMAPPFEAPEGFVWRYGLPPIDGVAYDPAHEGKTLLNQYLESPLASDPSFNGVYLKASLFAAQGDYLSVQALLEPLKPRMVAQ